MSTSSTSSSGFRGSPGQSPRNTNESLASEVRSRRSTNPNDFSPLMTGAFPDSHGRAHTPGSSNSTIYSSPAAGPRLADPPLRTPPRGVTSFRKPVIKADSGMTSAFDPADRELYALWAPAPIRQYNKGHETPSMPKSSFDRSVRVVGAEAYVTQFPINCSDEDALVHSLCFSSVDRAQYDHEIFDLVSELEAAEGKETTFYSFLEVPHTATASEIGKAYRKKSITMHPDKNPGVKDIHARFARLGIISTILRNAESRERYDFFYKNGVPKWRGTGYYYSRFRPGLGTVLTFLVILSSGLQYVVQKMTYKNDLARIEQFITKARMAAWGPKMNRIEGKRKVKVNAGGSTYVTEDGEEYTSGGKWLEMVVEGDQVYLLEPDGELLPLNHSATSPPALTRTWFLVLLRSLYERYARTSSHKNEWETDFDDSGEGSDRADGEITNENALQGRTAASKARGRRRKGVKRR